MDKISLVLMRNYLLGGKEDLHATSMLKHKRKPTKPQTLNNYPFKRVTSKLHIKNG